MVSNTKNIIYVGDFAPKNLMQAAVEDVDSLTQEQVETLLAFANGKQAPVKRSRRKSVITTEEQTNKLLGFAQGAKI